MARRWFVAILEDGCQIQRPLTRAANCCRQIRRFASRHRFHLRSVRQESEAALREDRVLPDYLEEELAPELDNTWGDTGKAIVGRPPENVKTLLGS